jgi:hypothetical protein
MKARSALLLAVVGGLFVVGCEEKGANPVTSAANKAAGAAKDAGKAVGDTAAKGVEAVKDAGADAMKAGTDAAKDAVAKGTDAVKDAAAAIKADAAKWVTDTVEKQWPEAKKTLEEAGKKVASITDAANKTKAEGIVKDLTAQIPSMEKLVGDLKAGTGDIGKMLTEGKAKFDGFMKGLGDLKGLVGLK